MPNWGLLSSCSLRHWLFTATLFPLALRNRKHARRESTWLAGAIHGRTKTCGIRKQRLGGTDYLSQAPLGFLCFPCGFLHKPTILHRQRLLKSDKGFMSSEQIGQVSEPYKRIARTGVICTLPLSLTDIAATPCFSVWRMQRGPLRCVVGPHLQPGGRPLCNPLDKWCRGLVLRSHQQWWGQARYLLTLE